MYEDDNEVLPVFMTVGQIKALRALGISITDDPITVGKLQNIYVQQHFLQKNDKLHQAYEKERREEQKSLEREREDILSGRFSNPLTLTELRRVCDYTGVYSLIKNGEQPATLTKREDGKGRPFYVVKPQELCDLLKQKIKIALEKYK